MKVLSISLFNEIDLASDATSEILDIQGILCFGMMATVAGGTPAGSYQLQVSYDPVTTSSQVVNWANKGSAITISATGNVETEYEGLRAAKWLRVVFSENSGVGTLTLNFHGKGG